MRFDIQNLPNFQYSVSEHHQQDHQTEHYAGQIEWNNTLHIFKCLLSEKGGSKNQAYIAKKML